MVLVLAKAAGLLLMPPGIFILGALIAIVVALRFPRAARVLGLLVLIAAYALSIRPVAEPLIATLEDRHPPLQGVPDGAKAIVVLGAGQVFDSPAHAGPWLSDAALQRVHHAARLARDSDLPIYTTGGTPLGHGIPSARIMARALIRDYGVTPRRITEETASRNTAEHPQFLKPLLGHRDRIVLVTTAWHMPRSVATFRAAGLEPIPAPTDYHPERGKPFHWLDWIPSASALTVSRNAFHEYLGLAYYRLRGWV